MGFKHQEYWYFLLLFRILESLLHRDVNDEGQSGVRHIYISNKYNLTWTFESHLAVESVMVVEGTSQLFG